MKQMTTTVTAVARAGHSDSNNPRWVFITKDGTYPTDHDVAQSYELTGNESGPAQIWLNAHNKIHRWAWQDNTQTQN